MLRQINYANLLLKRLALSYVTTLGDWNDVRTSIEKKEDKDMKRQRLIDIRSCLNSRINDHLDCTVFGPRCQFLCQSIYEKLPLELRELVYGSLFAEPRVKITDFYLDVTESDCGEAHFPPGLFNIIKAAPYAHVFQDLYAHIAVRIEMLKIWYQNTTFMFDDSVELDDKETDGIASLDLISFFQHDQCANYKLRDVVRTIELALPLPRHRSEERLLSSHQTRPWFEISQ